MTKLKTSLILLLTSGLIHAAIQPADGLWGTSDDPTVGSGLMLTTQNGITLVSIFTYDQDGNNAWYIASGQVADEGVFEAELRQTQNGSNIIEDNPEAAEFTETVRSLRLEFLGTQYGIMSIDGSEAKPIRAQQYGYANNISFPDLSGKWVFVDQTNNKSVILDLEPIITGSITGFASFGYKSNHVSSENWEVSCGILLHSPESGSCSVTPDASSSFSESLVDFSDLGNQRMTTRNNGGKTYQAFRLNPDNRLLPNDGHWRSYDDPAVGSGLVLRTQGIYTVALLYSYDDEGTPTWQIASGQFDEEGYFSAELLTPSAGTAIENETQEAATFGEQIQTIEIQMQGLELATFSIDGSTPKTIQNVNFGVTNYQTEMFTPNELKYTFPDQLGSWVIVDEDTTTSAVITLQGYNPNCCQSPPDPQYFNSVGYANRPLFGNVEPDPNFSIYFNCVKKQVPHSNFVFPVTTFCYGKNFRDEENGLIKIYFEDIGFNEFRYYIGPRNGFVSFEEQYRPVNRDSSYYQLFRLND